MRQPYFVYITTNPARNILYTGITNDLHRRLQEHYTNRGDSTRFAGRYYCYKLLYYEYYQTSYEAIELEKQIKKWRRSKKEALIVSVNPEWKFLNYTDDFCLGKI